MRLEAFSRNLKGEIRGLQELVELDVLEGVPKDQGKSSNIREDIVKVVELSERQRREHVWVDARRSTVPSKKSRNEKQVEVKEAMKV